MLFRSAYISRAEPGWPCEFVSDNIARYGFTAAEFTSGQRPFPTIVHPDDLPGLMVAADQAVAANVPERERATTSKRNSWISMWRRASARSRPQV